jgi:hypothetical protein
MRLNRANICRRCRDKDKNKDYSLISDENNIDPGDMPSHLPTLSQIEEMLIARAYVYIEVKRIRGLQYQYTRHTVCFINKSAKLYNALLLLPKYISK